VAVGLVREFVKCLPISNISEWAFSWLAQVWHVVYCKASADEDGQPADIGEHLVPLPKWPSNWWIDSRHGSGLCKFVLCMSPLPNSSFHFLRWIFFIFKIPKIVRQWSHAIRRFMARLKLSGKICIFCKHSQQANYKNIWQILWTAYLKNFLSWFNRFSLESKPFKYTMSNQYIFYLTILMYYWLANLVFKNKIWNANSILSKEIKVDKKTFNLKEWLRFEKEATCNDCKNKKWSIL
jgi:hypothetical protein